MDFIPIPNLNAQEEADLANLHAQVNPTVQLAQALNQHLQQIDDLIALADVQASLSDNDIMLSSDSSVNMQAQEASVGTDVNVDLVLALPAQIRNNGLGVVLPNNADVENPDFMQMDNVLIGRVITHNAFPADPGFKAYQNKAMPDTYRLWAKHFTTQEGSSLVKAHVPIPWSDFFTNILLSPTHFDWAKQFLTSKAWEIIQASHPESSSLQFSFPVVCPSSPLVCHNFLGSDTTPSDSMQAPPKTPRKKKLIADSNAKILEGENIRRSLIVKTSNRGFRKNSCTEKNCPACAVEPPTLSASVIRNLGTSFCELEATQVEEYVLKNKGKAVKKVVGKTTKDKKIAKKPSQSEVVIPFAPKPKAKKSGAIKKQKTNNNDDDKP